MRFVFKMIVFPFWLLTAFLALMLKWTLNLSAFVLVLPIDQMCEILSVSTKTGYALLKKGSIQHLKVGRSYRIPKAHLLTYLIGFAPGHTIRA